MTTLEATDLHKAFGSQAVLCGIELFVPEASLTAILGPSGSGKTTLLRILAGFERSDRGRVTLGGRLVEDGRRRLPPERRGIGYVPQEGALFPHLTVEKNIAFGLGRRGRRDGRVRRLMDMVGLGELARRYPHELSGGEQQRVALARALAIEPEVVLLDEPFSSLDAGLRAAVRADVQRVLRESGTTALLVTHDQDEALSMADLVAVIRDGRIAQSGTPQELYDQPVDPAMADFLGDANLIHGSVDSAVAFTPLGPLALRPGSVRAQEPTPAVVMVRPEQMEIRPGPADDGLAARVLESQFHGHDTVMLVKPDESCGIDVLVVRTDGELTLVPGAPVTVTARGSVLAWPDPAP
ncbi:MAG TPA: ABC transporter ATP-binding protein [Acidimicrobiales bacterium]|nr:ABC transporter ATP-binding protein [Acidimicrobiales bacterium]